MVPEFPEHMLLIISSTKRTNSRRFALTALIIHNPHMTRLLCDIWDHRLHHQLVDQFGGYNERCCLLDSRVINIHEEPEAKASEDLPANVITEHDDLKVTPQKMDDQHILRGTWMIYFRTKLPTRQAFSTDGTLRRIYYDVLRLSGRRFSDSVVQTVRLNMPQNVRVSQSDHKARALEAAKLV